MAQYCAKLTPHIEVRRFLSYFFEKYVMHARKNYPTHPPQDANFWQRMWHLMNTPL